MQIPWHHCALLSQWGVWQSFANALAMTPCERWHLEWGLWALPTALAGSWASGPPQQRKAVSTASYVSALSLGKHQPVLAMQSLNLIMGWKYGCQWSPCLTSPLPHGKYFAPPDSNLVFKEQEIVEIWHNKIITNYCSMCSVASCKSQGVVYIVCPLVIK